MVAIQNFIGPNATGYTGQGGGGAAQVSEMLYFCIPKNEKIMAYWKTIADRLFKIRNSMNIEGIQRLLPLYEPEIDPALLVKAVAAGLSMEKVMNEINGVGATNYRFAFMLQKANELCSDVKSLGGALLSALEKKDAEDLALLRSGQEINLLNQVKAIKELQLNEAESNLESALKTKEITELKQNYYIAQSAEYMNPKEKESQTEYKKGVKKQEISQGISATASVMSAIPNAHLQGVASGTSINISTIAKAASEVVGLLAYIHSSNSTLASTIAGYDRRRTDWNFQIETSKIELKQLEKQILSAEIRVQVAQKELDNHILQMENTQTNDAFMRSKYTNKQLYNWMVGEISATYFQSYKLAYDLARKAEATFKRELPVAKVPPTGIIQYGYWDSLKKGLLSGEKLQLDLRKLDLAYIENNKREFELTKHVSLANYSPESLMDLRDTGECSFNLSRDLFDLDFPGHYLRRIKSVSVSIPCIAGPYTTIPATLTYNKTGTGGKIRLNTGASPDLMETNIIERIATSSAQNDSGIFELNFRDERYVPFENLGVEDSDWSIELMTNANLRQFDYNTITDLIIHIKYTSRDGGDTEKGLVMTDISSRLTLQPILFYQLFSIKTMFANEWNKYLNDVDGGIGTPTLDIQLNHEKFPYFCMGKTIQLTSLTFELQTIDGESIADIDITDSVKTVDIANLSTATNILTDNTLTGVSFIQGADLSFVFSLKTGGTQLTIGTLSKIRDLNLAVIYKLS
jgi:hypothetical protein